MELTGAQIMMKVLKEERVETIFGFPGGVVIDIFDELVERITLSSFFKCH